MTSLRLALVGLLVVAVLFRLIVWASTRVAHRRVSLEWLNENAYSRRGDEL